ALVVQAMPGPAGRHHQRGDQPVAQDDTGDGQRAERVRGAVPVRRGGGVDPRGQVAGPGERVPGHRVTPAGLPSAIWARLRSAMLPGLKYPLCPPPPQAKILAPKAGAIGSWPKPSPRKWRCGTCAIQSPAPRPAHTRAVVCSARTEEASIPGLPTTAMSVTGRCAAARPQTKDP